MKKIKRLTISFSLLLLSSIVCSAGAGDKTKPGKKIIYKHTNGKPQALEVYFPKDHNPTKDKRPCLLLFHGGGWGSGDLSTFRYDCEYFASRGIVAATANYYMVPKAERKNLPAGTSNKSACITDAKSAIRWMKQHADELGIDPRKFVVGGGSAGGHISMLSTTNPGLNDPKDPKKFNTDVMAYVLFNPALTAADEKFPDVNALNYLTDDFPPAVVFFGTKDKWRTGWNTAHKKLNTLGAGDRIELWTAEGQPHAFFNKQPWKDLVLIETDRFLVSLGLLNGEPTLILPADGTRITKEKK